MTMLKPTKGRVVVSKIDMAAKTEEKMSSSGIILGEALSSTMAGELEYRLGRVLALPDSDNGEAGVNIGEMVVWRKFEGVETQHDGEEVVILTYDEILGVAIDA